MNIFINIVRVMTAIFAVSGLLGYENGLIFTIISLGALNIAYGVEFYKKRQRGQAVSSALIGVCILVIAAVQIIQKI